MVPDFEKIKILSHDFPMKEIFLWNESENRQVKLHSEHDKTAIFEKSFKIEGLFPRAKLKTFLLISQTWKSQPIIQ